MRPGPSDRLLTRRSGTTARGRATKATSGPARRNPSAMAAVPAKAAAKRPPNTALARSRPMRTAMVALPAAASVSMSRMLFANRRAEASAPTGTATAKASAVRCPVCT